MEALPFGQFDFQALEGGFHGLEQVMAFGGCGYPGVGGQSGVGVQPGFQRADMRRVPAGVYGPEFRQVQVQRQGAEPVQHLFVQVRVAADLLQEGLMLVAVLGGVRAQVFTGLQWVRRGPGDRVELMVAHDRQRFAGLNHGTHDAHYLQLLGPAVDVVAQKQSLAGRVPPDTVGFRVAQPVKQPLQGFGVAVDIANDVVHD